MGISLQEILELDFFRNFEVIAGRGGLHKEVQGITALEAPDCFRWAIGKELVVSSGYVLQQDPNCLKRALDEGKLAIISGLMVKMDRYITAFSPETIKIFDENNLPLIKMPDEIPWMDVITRITTAVMNRTIQGMEIFNNPGKSIIDKSYKERKIRQILRMAETGMGFPALLYDIGDEIAYYSSDHFKEATNHYGLVLEDYWMPKKEHTEVVLCDHIGMSRYRIMGTATQNQPPVSWITIPIIAEKTVRAYFVVMESRELIDYYDEMAIRMAFLMLHGMYEQINAVRAAGNIGFENFILYALDYREPDNTKLIYQAGVQGVSLNERYSMALMQVRSGRLHLREQRLPVVEAFRKSGLDRFARLVILERKEALILVKHREDRREEPQRIDDMLVLFADQLKKLSPGCDIRFGKCNELRSIKGIRSSVEKCRKALGQGINVYPDRIIWDYDAMGPFAWLQIPEEELEKMLAVYREILKNEKNTELLRTLMIYLENNMNYSATAEKMYVHINTIRKRIDKINELLEVNWDNPVERMQVEILLHYLHL